MVLNTATVGEGVLVEGLAMAYSASVARKQAEAAGVTVFMFQR